MRRKSRLLGFLGFIIFIVILGILGVTIITALDILEIVEVPEQYSLTKFITTSTEVSLKDYTNTVEDVKEKISTQNIKKVENNEKSNNNIIVEIPAGLESVYSDNSNSGNSNENNKTIEKYYYNQLDEYGKIIYDKMIDNIENLKTGTYTVKFDTEFNKLLQQEEGEIVMENAFQSALNALIYDNPGIFYLDITKMYLYTETTTIVIKKTYKIYIGPVEGGSYLAEGFNSKQDVEDAISQVNQKVERIKFNLSTNDNSNIKILHDYLIDNVSYDETVSIPNIYNIYGTLINGIAVCEGYAKTMKYLLDQIGIDSMFVFGTGTNSKGQTENHAWNDIKLNGNWYALDTTWDDPILIGGGTLTNSYRYKYFLKGSDEFYKDHFEDGSIVEGVKFYYPTLSISNF